MSTWCWPACNMSSACRRTSNYYRVREMLREIAAKENVMIIRRYEAMQFIAAAQEAGGGFGPDEFERTEAGYNCLAQYLASAITVGAFGKGMSGRPLRGQGPPQPAAGATAAAAAKPPISSADRERHAASRTASVAPRDARGARSCSPHTRTQRPSPISTKARTCG